MGGMLLVAPEHRSSLELKIHELRLKGEMEACKALAEVAGLPYLDLLDESDELLHHRFVNFNTFWPATQCCFAIQYVSRCS